MKLKTKPQTKKYISTSISFRSLPDTYIIQDQLGNTVSHKSTTQVSDPDFVKAWMTCTTVEQVATKLSMTREHVSSKAHTLRAKGVHLPSKRNKVDPNSVDALNKLIAKYTGK